MEMHFSSSRSRRRRRRGKTVDLSSDFTHFFTGRGTRQQAESASCLLQFIIHFFTLRGKEIAALLIVNLPLEDQLIDQIRTKFLPRNCRSQKGLILFEIFRNFYSFFSYENHDHFIIIDHLVVLIRFI